MNSPKVSVIIPCYNLGLYIDEAVDSVLSQTYQDFEIIIIDDGSTDQYTRDLLKNYLRPQCQILKTENQGVSSARNLGINASKGSYILPLDADDIIGDTYLEKAVKILDENKKIGIVYSEVELFGEVNAHWKLPPYQFPEILLRNSIVCTGLFRAEDFKQTKGYDVNLIYGREDHDFWLSIIELGREVYRIPEVLFFYRQRAASRDKSLTREQLIYSHSQIFKNHSHLYCENIEFIFKNLIDLTVKVESLEEQLQKTQIEATLQYLKLRELNFVLFPDWNQPEESLSADFQKVISVILSHPDQERLTLLINTDNILEESEFDAELFFSSVVMNLLMQENVEVTSEPQISFFGELSEKEWEALLPYLNSRIRLENENQQALSKFNLDNLLVCEPDHLIDLKDLQIEEALLNQEVAHRYYQEGNYEEAFVHCQKCLNLQLGNVEIYFLMSESLWQLNRLDEAILSLQKGIDLHPNSGKLHFSLIMKLLYSAKNKEAISTAEKISQLLPNDYTFKVIENLIVPVIYEKQEDIAFYRQRFTEGLQNLIQQTVLEAPEEKTGALAGIGCFSNFYLTYQAQNDISLQRQYGSLVHQIMAANYPQWVQPLSMPPLYNNKIRVGYVSEYFHAYSGTLWLIGWLRRHDKNNFEIYCYYTGNEPDYLTEQFRKSSDVFYHLPANQEAVYQQIIADRLHILFFPEIGMNPPTLQMAALRLAAVQCTAWGHPITTGLPTVDYYLSGNLMEPENAQEHYSETLIRLPNIAVSYPKPAIPPLTKNRSNFHLREDAVIYLCCQAPFKYLPQQDYILPKIAQRIPNAQFIFIRADILKHRLDRAFAEVGLNAEQYCVFLPVQARNNYLMLNLLSDVYLDSFGFSGGNTTLDAIACNLPVVTCPGEFMRGRLSYGILRMLGVTETIAQTEAEYIEIAVRLGLDRDWRQEIAEKIRMRHDNLFDDKVCVEALEAFYKQVVQERLS
ncbi:MAG: glycosyltransferase [Microcoleus vaginatus WJT46-NPBG5]|jgi:predicted O-linked N-acetylglucosamine transferase (SPINDLY family)/glycosyltransferase involved in cell wall biosynthesis|nr:glycosyltransferase [Microcoleus vaginatus WJT46-NPBG5]